MTSNIDPCSCPRCERERQGHAAFDETAPELLWPGQVLRILRLRRRLTQPQIVERMPLYRRRSHGGMELARSEEHLSRLENDDEGTEVVAPEYARAFRTSCDSWGWPLLHSEWLFLQAAIEQQEERLTRRRGAVA